MTEQTPADSQAARWDRRESLARLLSRMQRGVLLEQERDLLRAAVETELRDGDQAREQLAAAAATPPDMVQRAAELRRRTADLVQRAEEIEQRVKRAEHDHEQHRTAIAAALGVDPILDWDELIEATTHTAQLAMRLHRQLVSAQATIEGLSETMRNTDRLTTAALRGTRSNFERAQERVAEVEATLAVVREAVAEVRRATLPRSEQDRHIAAIEAALDGPLRKCRRCGCPANTGCSHCNACDVPDAPALVMSDWANADGATGTCRLLETRTCPSSYGWPCDNRCARFESNDPAPWMPTPAGAPSATPQPGV